MNSKKILVPLATLVAAGAVAVGSGATFDSTTGNTISSVTSGTLTHTNSKKDAAIFNLTNMKPGDVVNGGLTIANTGSLPATFSLSELSSVNGFADSYLTLTITNDTAQTTVWSGNFGNLPDGVKQDLGQIAAGASTHFTFSVKLDPSAPNSQQGKTASASYQWDSVQLPAQTFNQP